MQSIFGETRTRVGQRHALIAPDGHVPSALPGFDGATPHYLISPGMGANLSQLLILFEPGGTGDLGPDGRERFFHVEEGELTIQSGESKESVSEGGYVYVPADRPCHLTGSKGGARVTCFEKVFQPLQGEPALDFLSGDSNQITGEPFLGNNRALLQTLLPDAIAWDMAVNIFTYEPGATLPFVETHIMEHGLLMLEGQGVYRLEDRYYPVMKGDVIWMAPYCPQWFVAMGDEPASYLYYKNINRPE